MITAEEFCNERLGFEEYGTDVPYFMIEFAKLHVEAALNAAKSKCDDMTNSESLGEYVKKSYPLENIK